jgi:hypothetical protein
MLKAVELLPAFGRDDLCVVRYGFLISGRIIISRKIPDLFLFDLQSHRGRHGGRPSRWNSPLHSAQGGISLENDHESGLLVLWNRCLVVCLIFL